MILSNIKTSNSNSKGTMSYEKTNKPAEVFNRVFREIKISESKFLDIMDIYFDQLCDNDSRALCFCVEENDESVNIQSTKIKNSDYWVHCNIGTGDYSIHSLYAKSPKGGEPELWSKELHGEEFPEIRVKKPKEENWSGSICAMKKSDGTFDKVLVNWDNGKSQTIKDLSKIIFEWREDYEYFSQFFSSKG